MTDTTRGTTMNGKTALVLGATGGIGGEVARQLHRAGWRVRGLVRGLERVAGRHDGIDWIEGDAMNAADVLRKQTHIERKGSFGG